MCWIGLVLLLAELCLLVSSCSHNHDCARVICSLGDHAVCHNSMCLCSHYAGECSTDTDCSHGYCDPYHRHYCHRDRHECGCLHHPHESHSCLITSDCRYVHCGSEHYDRVCSSGKCYCMEKAPVPKCGHHHGPEHHDDHCSGVFCNSSYHAVCLWEYCACARTPVLKSECRINSDCTRTTCSDGESPICYHSMCLCKRRQGYCSTDADCGFGDCGPDYHHRCHTETHTCGCIHAPHDSSRCTGDRDCGALHCEHHHDHHQPICDRSKCNCIKSIHVPECEGHHKHCPSTMCASSLHTVCLQDQCTCLREPLPPVCHSDADCSRTHNCSSNQWPRCVEANCTCVVTTVTTNAPTPIVTSEKPTVTTNTNPQTPISKSEMPTVGTDTDPQTPISTSGIPTALHTNPVSTASGSTSGILCPECSETLNCTWTRTCPPSHTCLIRSYRGNFTVHCSVRGDCHFIQSVLPTSEVFCCDDKQCLHKYLGI